MTVYRRPDPIPLPHARPVHGQGRAVPPADSLADPSRKSHPVLSETVAHDLALSLMAGQFLRAGVLWTEAQLCAAFGVSRTALREAIKILSAKGIVETRRKRGTILRPRADWNLLDPDIIRWLLAAEPERTRADLTEALRFLADATPRDRAGNPFLAAFAQATGQALAEETTLVSAPK